MTGLRPRDAIAFVAGRLEARGFVVVARNERGDSIYLAPEGSRYRLRVSNHARTPKQRRVHAEVLASLVLRAPRSREQLERMIEAALRDFAAALARRQAAGSCPDG